MANHSLLSPAIEEWLIWRANAAGVAKTTLKIDAVHLRRFLGSTGNIQCRNITGIHVERALADAANLKFASVNQYVSRLRSFFEFCHLRGYLPRSVQPCAGIRARRGVNRPRAHLAPELFGPLLDAANDTRDRALLACGLYLFTRQSETARLRVGDVNLPARTVSVTVTKTHQSDVMVMPAELETEIRAWLTDYTREVGKLEPHFYLFPSRQGMSATRLPGGQFVPGVTAFKLRPGRPIADPGKVARYALDAVGFPTRDETGQPLHTGSHTLRASGARAWFDSLAMTHDRALKIVAARLHHSNLATTEIYLGVELDKIAGDELLAGRPMLPELSTARTAALRLAGNE